ncbi:MAG: acylphosphatase [Atopobiaceae bacterium]|nr:acylphosphatase [Atopobiaceae bacterium]
MRYTGRVQAVGFRFTIDGCASEAGVTGWVRNMDDGSVVCEAQGTPEQVAEFRRLVQAQMDNPRTWINGRLDSSEAIEPKPDTRFSILNL